MKKPWNDNEEINENDNDKAKALLLVNSVEKMLLLTDINH